MYVRIISYLLALAMLSQLCIAEERSKPVYVTEAFLWARLIQSGEQTYPLISGRQMVPGFVMFSVTIDKMGRVVSFERLNDNPLLNKSAEEFISSMRFEPYLRGNQVRRMTGYITVHYDLAEPMAGLHLPIISCRGDGQFSFENKTLDSQGVLFELDQLEAGANDKIAHLLVEDIDAVSKPLELLRKAGIRNIHIRLRD